MSRPCILIVDDDADISLPLALFLDGKGFDARTAHDAASAEGELARGGIDLILLDVMLPGEDGISFCRRVYTPDGPRIIMLTALSESMDKVVGLEVGADKYLTKPVDLRELLAHIRALLRRSPLGNEAVPAPAAFAQTLSFAGFTFTPTRRLLRSPTGLRVPLTGAEADLLLVLCQHPKQVLSREELIRLTRGEGFPIATRSIDLLVSRLRRKLAGNSPLDDLIRTMRADGYAFHATVACA